MQDFQRIGSVSNAHVGRDFEDAALVVLADNGIHVEKDYSVKIGVGIIKKGRKFDLGSDNPPVLVECKSHTWTSSGNVPSAKITVWNEAMYYFSMAPKHYRKIFFVQRYLRDKNNETLAEYYLRTYPHLIPEDVEFWEYNDKQQTVTKLKV